MKLNNVYSGLLIVCLLPALSGCAAALVGGGAVAAGTIIDRRTTGTQIEDQSIEFKANQAINKDVELNEQAHINVTSYNTVVLLTGETPTEEMRQRAVDIIKSLEKVTHIYNELSIAAPSSMTARSSDSIITSKVKTKMLSNQELSGLAVKVITEKGVVYLMGLVSKREAELATDIARQTGGVQKVVKLFQYID